MKVIDVVYNKMVLMWILKWLWGLRFVMYYWYNFNGMVLGLGGDGVCGDWYLVVRCFCMKFGCCMVVG